MKKQSLRIAIAQINPTVGDLMGNTQKITQYMQRAQVFAVDIVVFPELCISGYPPEDLLLMPKFINDNLEKVKELALSVKDTAVIIGFVDKVGKDLFNASALLYKGKIVGIYHKMFLPNYGVFDEKRYFTPGTEAKVFKFKDCILGINICEDIWQSEGPIKEQARKGAKIIININASPYYAGKMKERQKIVSFQAKENGVRIVYANLVGGQDELVFDGASMFADAQGKIISTAEVFKESLLIAELDISKKSSVVQKISKLPGPVEEIYQALLLGVSDYVSKNGFKKAVIGLSGGIDSGLTAVLAADALGAENVIAVFMPTRYSSIESEVDARQLAQNLGIKFLKISIEQIYKMYLMVLEPHFVGSEKNIAEENLQARIRGNILMALSNKFGWLVLTTGNKSEMSTGYATLYGDMAGGFAVIKDVPKVVVYKLCYYRNGLSPIIPERMLSKAPTAELKPNQKDSDTLPAYETLDPILKAYVEEDRDLNNIVSKGFDKEVVKKVIDMVDKSEYKRRQAPPGIKITPKAFGRDRRMPITNRYRG